MATNMSSSMNMYLRWCPVFVILTFLIINGCYGASYHTGEEVMVYVNKVGPYFNPHETYHYYQLPVCRPEKIVHKSLTLGEVLDGDRMAESSYKIRFRDDVDSAELCTLSLSDEDLEALKASIEDLYYFEFVMDDIPLRGFVGHLEETSFIPHSHKLYLWTHLHFTIEYNDKQIIFANVSTKERRPIRLDEAIAPMKISHTYSVKWIPSSLPYSQRAKRIQDTNFFPRSLEIHWLSIINSMVLVFLLIGFVLIILTRVLKNDFKRYGVNGDDMETEELDGDDYGWKIIHTDVFRFPSHKHIFCAILGVGTQFVAVGVGIIGMALLGFFNVHRHGAVNSAACFLYALTSIIAGFVSGNTYRQMGGDRWVANVNLTSCFFALPFFVIWSIQNSVAWGYHSTQALPYTTIILLIAVWIFVGYPLTVLGGILGKNMRGGFDAPCRTKNIAREIPAVPFYRGPLAHCFVGGFLPFSAISVELYYIFATLWGREQYTLYGILGVVFFILLSVTAAISIALTYFQLAAEDYRWWWRSIFSAGCTGVFVFLYAIFYYGWRSNMSGVLQSAEFFSWTILMCYIFFLSLGTVSFFSSLAFIRYIYANIKMD